MLRAREVMSTPVVTVRPEATIKEVADLMAAHHVSGLPVVDGSGRPIGVIAEADFIERIGAVPRRGWFRRRGTDDEEAPDARGLRVADLMTAPAITATPDAPVRELAQLMAARDVNRILIVEDGLLAGIVARADVVRAFVRTDAAIRDEIRYRLTHELWIDATHLAVQVQDGAVTLAGEVETHADAILAARMAAATEGVFSVEAGDLRYRVEAARSGDAAARAHDQTPPDPKDEILPFAT